MTKSIYGWNCFFWLTGESLEENLLQQGIEFDHGTFRVKKQ